MSNPAVESPTPRAVLPLERDHPWNPRCHQTNPLFWPLERVMSFFSALEDWPDVTELDRVLSPLAGIHFQEQPPRIRRRRRGRRPPVETESLYDARIHLSGWVPTRPRNWHDFLNALVWATFPRAKRAFHARQHAAVTSRIAPGSKVLPGTRSREMDGLAILDEGGLLLLVAKSREPHITQCVNDRALEPLHRAIVDGEAVALLFGHALYETLLGPDASKTWAMVTTLACSGELPEGEAERIEVADERLAELLADGASFSNPAMFRSVPLNAQLLRP